MLEEVIVTDARLNAGYSGGPLVDASGVMKGLNTAYISSRGIAIPVNKVRGIVEKLKRGGRIKRAHLGIVSNSISLPQEIATQSEIAQDQAIIVLSVDVGSSAKKAGLTIGDIIVRFNEKPVTSVYDLVQLLTEEMIGKPAVLEILRGEKLTKLGISPGEANE